MQLPMTIYEIIPMEHTFWGWTRKKTPDPLFSSDVVKEIRDSYAVYNDWRNALVEVLKKLY